MKNTRKSVRIYVNENDIKSGTKLNGWHDAIHAAVARLGLLKGKCFIVGNKGIHIGPNRAYISTFGLAKEPEIQLSNKGIDFLKTFDKFGRKTAPTHITLIDKSGKYL